MGLTSVSAPGSAKLAIKTGVVTFSDWENRVLDGETFTAGPQLQRLVLTEDCGRFLVHIPADGHYLVFEGCGDHPLHIHIASKIVKPAWQKDFQHSHSHEDDVSSVGISTHGDLDGKKLNWVSPGGYDRVRSPNSRRLRTIASSFGS